MMINTSTFAFVAVLSLALATNGQQQENPPKASTDSAEETAWKDVNCFDKQSLQSFIQAFASGKHTQDAKDALELNTQIQNIRNGKETVKFAIQFDDLEGGDAWAAPGDVGFTGKGIHRLSGDYLSRYAFFPPMDGGKTPGINVISFDSSGNPRVSVTDGSIVGFATDGVDLVFYGGTKFRTPGNAPAFFAVIKGKGFVHLKGAVSVTVKGKETVDLK